MPYLTVPSPLGDLTLFEENGQLVALDWGAVDGESETPLLQAAARQLDAYFDGRLRQFDLPLAPAGTTFQKRVWSAMQAIPYGQVLRYADVARMLNSGPRAVGGACGRNPLSILIPCHRVIGSDGSLTGYAGGLQRKIALLKLESSH